MSAPAQEAVVRRSSAKLGRAERKEARKHLEGRVVRSAVSVTSAMRTLAQTLVQSLQLDVVIQDPQCVTASTHQFRPCVVLSGSRRKGYTVLPLATFGKADPEDMDDLLRAVVLPIGDITSVHNDFLDRRRFQTTPPWDVEKGPAYIVPQIVRLPPHTPIEPLNGSILPPDLAELREFCTDYTKRMIADYSPEELKSLVLSFDSHDRSSRRSKANRLRKKKNLLPNGGDDEDDEEDLVGPQSPTSTLNPLAPPFVPRSLYDTSSDSDFSSFDAFSSDSDSSSVFETSEASSSDESAHNEPELPVVKKKVLKRARFAKWSKKPAPAGGKENEPP